MPHQQSFNHEPRLDEILGDPIVRLVMDKDGAEEADLRTLMMAVRKARFRRRITVVGFEAYRSNQIDP